MYLFGRAGHFRYFVNFTPEVSPLELEKGSFKILDNKSPLGRKSKLLLVHWV